VQISPLLDLHYLVRAIAGGEATLPEQAALDEAVQAARDLDKELGSPLAWGLLEGNLTVARTAAEAATLFERLPERFELRGTGRSIAPRQSAVRLARALAGVEAPFREQVWPRHREIVERAAATIERELAPKERDCFDDIARSLGMTAADVVVPVYLVAQAPRPQGFTYRRPGGRTASVVGVEGRSGSLLFEVILHEAIHVLDVATEGQPSALSGLRARLERAGLDHADPLAREVVHTLMFVQAGETVRRVLDPSHRHYGEVAGYYAKSARVAQLELAIWKDRLDGKLPLDEALDRIAAGIVQARAGEARAPRR
jgi:hypothetical protein